MTAREFMVDVYRDGDAVVVAPHGELDLATVGGLRDELAHQAGAALLVLDLRGLSFMDSSGLALVVEQQRRAEAEGGDFRVVPGSGLVRRLFEVTGVVRHLRWTEVSSQLKSTVAGEVERQPAGDEAAVQTRRLSGPARE
jgi:anti-sigma B factor antagonist